MSGSFADILNTPMNEVEKPKPRPVGSYIGVIQGAHKIEKIGKNETQAAIFTVKLIAPGPDVDPGELAAAGGIGERTVRVTQFLTKDALWRLKEFLLALGIEEGRGSMAEAMAQTPNRQALFKIKHRPSPDGMTLFEEVDSVAAL